MLFCGKLFLVLSAVTILTQVVAFVNDFLGKVVKAGTGARRPEGSFRARYNQAHVPRAAAKVGFTFLRPPPNGGVGGWGNTAEGRGARTVRHAPLREQLTATDRSAAQTAPEGR